jgi:hypothetical protein
MAEEFNQADIWLIIKDGLVVNTIHFNDEVPMFIETLKDQLQVDDVINCKDLQPCPGIGWTYDNKTGKFVEPPKAEPVPPPRPEGLTD